MAIARVWVLVAFTLAICNPVDGWLVAQMQPTATAFTLSTLAPAARRPSVPAGARLYPGPFARRAVNRRRAVRGSCIHSLRAAAGDMVEYGGSIASLDESMAIFRIAQKRDASGEVAGAAWLAKLTDQEMLRLLRARRRNVYGHDWRLQGADGKAAVLNGAWDLAVAHAKWREDLRMDDLLRKGRFATDAEVDLRQSGVLGLISTHVAWLDARVLQECAPACSTDSGAGPVLWVRMPRAAVAASTADLASSLMFEVALACEWANAHLGVGVSQQAQLLLDMTHADDAVLGACLSLVLEHVAKPRLASMAVQLLNPIEIASHPPPSVLPLDHFPECFHRITVLSPAPAPVRATEQSELDPTTNTWCCSVSSVWRVLSTVADAIPMADTLAAAFVLNSDTRAKISVVPLPAPQEVRVLDDLARVLLEHVAASPPLAAPLLNNALSDFRVRC